MSLLIGALTGLVMLACVCLGMWIATKPAPPVSEWQDRALLTLLNVAARIEQAEAAKREWTRMTDRRPIPNQACVIWALELDEIGPGDNYTFDTAQFRDSGIWESLDGEREWERSQVKFWAYVENPPND